MTIRQFIVEGVDNMRLDVYLSSHLGLMNRSRLKERVTVLRVNGKEVKPSFRVCEGDSIELEYDTPAPPSYTAENLPLNILFEDNEVIIVNKKRGMVVHPAAGNHSGTLVQGLMYHINELSTNFSGDRIRPGIVHRLDKDTSGIIIAAKNPESLEFLSSQFRNKTVSKTYLAVVRGRLYPLEGRVDKNIVRNPNNRKKFTCSETAGKKARTNYRVLRQYEDAALVALRPETGRTHQLRVHMSSIGNPILGDPLYSRKKIPGVDLMLHAYILNITLPRSETPSLFRAPPPVDFISVFQHISGENLKGFLQEMD